MATDDDSDVPESGGVFTFGKSKFADNVPSKFWVRNDPVAEVACGDEHTALVAESGRIFTFGANDWGQLGLGDGKQRTKPSCIKSLKSEKIRSVACGRSTTYVATEKGNLYYIGRRPEKRSRESGRVYSCGGNSESQLGQGVNDSSVNKPAKVEGLPSVKVKMLSAGADHVALLTEDGKVYVWGGGSEGQLGLGEEEECPTPKLLEVHEDVTCVSCGYYHTAFTTESGALYTFGESENGKLGLGEDPRNTNRPQKVSGIAGRVRMVACGGSHTVAVTTDGKVYTFGDGSNGQLGHGNIQLQATTPQEIMSLRDTKIHTASCGENHTALISFKGVLFTFGDGRHGKLGLGEENFANQFKPSAVTRFGAFTVERVACGGCHMLVLARPKLQNGEVSASDSDEPVEEETKPMKQLELLRRSDDLDLSGSFSARNRRREKQDPSASMSRTLPPLNSSIGGRVLPPLSSTVGSSIDNPLNKSMLPPLKKPGYNKRRKRFIRRNGESSSEEKREESTESEENKMPVKKESQDTLQAAPVPVPRITPRASPQPSPRPRVDREKLKKLEETEEDSEESEPKRTAIKPATQSLAKASPVPRPRFGTKVKPAAKTDSEEESDSEDSKKKVEKKTEKPSFRKQDSESEDEEDSKTKREKDKKKEVEKTNKKSRAKKRGGLFSKKNYLDSDEEDEKEESESESEESSEMDKRKNTKRSIFSRNSLKKEKSRQNKVKEKKDKGKKKEEESEDDESDKKKNNINKKVQSKTEEAESSGDKEEEDKSKEKEEEEAKPLVKKKSKLCVIL